LKEFCTWEVRQRKERYLGDTGNERLGACSYSMNIAMTLAKMNICFSNKLKPCG
jgi:hypothetical protein